MVKIEDLIEEARTGSADAMMSVGCAYADGQIVPHDYNQAMIWFERALRLGNLNALLELAVAYEYGLGFERDNDEAFELYMRAAGLLKSPLPFAIRGHVLTKNLCSQDYKGILTLAEAGYAHAMYYLASKEYENQNYYEKLDRYEKWMSKAAELDYPPAVVDYSNHNLDRERNRISAEEILSRELKAYKYEPSNALSISKLYSEKGLSNEYMSDAKNEIRGQRIGLTPDKALEEKWKKLWDEQHLEKLKWAFVTNDTRYTVQFNEFRNQLKLDDVNRLEKEAKNGSSSACIALAYKYMEGVDVVKDEIKAKYYFSRSCQLEKYSEFDSLPGSVSTALLFISRGYLDNLNDQELLEWLQQHTIAYDTNIKGTLFWIFKNSKIKESERIEWQKSRIERLMKSQFELLKKSAQNGNPQAQFYYSYNFKRYKKRPGNCLKWLLKSAEQGLVIAQYRVAMCYASGDGAPIDSKECLKWMLKAAMQGFTDAQRELVRLYTGNFLSRGGDPLKYDPIDIKDYVEALAWDIVSCDHRGSLEFYKKDWEKLTSDDIAKAYRRAKELKAAICSV